MRFFLQYLIKSYTKIMRPKQEAGRKVLRVKRIVPVVRNSNFYDLQKGEAL